MHAVKIVNRPSPLPPLPYNCCSIGAALKIKIKNTRIANIKKPNRKYAFLTEISFCLILLKNIGVMINNRNKTKATLGTITASLLLNGVMIRVIKTE
jgi:hypothetical protein